MRRRYHNKTTDCRRGYLPSVPRRRTSDNRAGHSPSFPHLHLALFRLLGFVMLLAGCLVFWVALIAAVALGPEYGVVGVLLFVGCFLMSYACFRELR